ncbi:MAG: HDOD domain-containing protein [Deltaproteobacteria bacterium]|nr:HDOD domain-containing protein [Deltaproteobacteria bacterium]
MSAIKALIQEIKRLKPVPQIANQVMDIVENPKASLSDVADIVSYDPMITANILRTCNSAYFGLSRKVDSVHEAVALIGIDHIVDLVLMNCVAENLKDKQEGYGLDEGELWRYSVSSAIIARELAEKRALETKQLVFTAALLKDIGKVILNRFVIDSFEKINNLVENRNLSFREAEKKVIGVDHAELGGLVASNWKFSPKMVYIIQNHHPSDEKARTDLETGLVYLSDIVCMMMGIGVGSDGLAYRFYDQVIHDLGFSEIDLQEIIANFSEKMAVVDELIKSV